MIKVTSDELDTIATALLIAKSHMITHIEMEIPNAAETMFAVAVALSHIDTITKREIV
jgi:hypothetical protein